jgi:hypothetical protein
MEVEPIFGIAADTMPLISITRLRVRSWRFLPSFFVYTLRSAKQARRAGGNLTLDLLNDRQMTFWTMTTWSSEQAMKAFIVRGVHGQAMKKLLEWCDEAAVVHWTQDGTELPSWPEAHARMQRDGRRSKVNHPSPAHIAYQIPAPRVRSRRV